MTTEETIRATITAYGQADLEGAMALCDDNICFRSQSHAGTRAWVFDCHDKIAFRKAIAEINSDLTILSYELIEIFTAGNRAATRQRVTLRAQTGEELTTEIAGFWTVEAGRITSLQEFADTATMARLRP